MEKQYDYVIVGSGISGMTMSLILGLLGKKVLLLEIASEIGGSLRRFKYDGIPYDVGFHFTGGLHEKGMLFDMFKVLGIWDSLEPSFLDEDNSCHFIIDDKTYNFPIGNEKIKNNLKNYFPQHVSAIEKYFQLVDEVCEKTDNMDLRHLNNLRTSQEYDFVSLKQVLDGLTDCDALKTLLSGYCMCYGIPPSQISFANHARICRDFYQSIGRVKLGGDAFVNAFKDAFSRVQVDILCNTTISECLDIDQARIGRLLLTNGDEVKFKSCIFAIHPKQILDILPKEKLRKALIHRVEDFQSSCGFFSVFGVRGGGNINGSNNITGMFTSANMESILSYDCPDDIAILLLRNDEIVNGEKVPVFTALEPSFVQATAAWSDSRAKRRSMDYYEYKQEKQNRIEHYLKNCFGVNGETFEIKTSSTMLTYRDYLHSPDGSAYGIKQLIGQFNLFGRLPLRNIYAIGQSALLPGIVGAMMSAFIVSRSVEDKEEIDKLIAKSLSI